MVKRHFNLIAILFVSGLLALSSTTFIGEMDLDNDQNNNNNIQESWIKSAELHSPIIISGNSQLESICTVGNGSIANPYVLENLLINVTPDVGINVSNTNKPFIIRNSILSNGDRAGILLSNCSNITIIHNDLSLNRYGIELDHSNYNLIADNNCSNNSIGISIGWSSSYNIIEENICTQNSGTGISIFEASGFNILSHNTCTHNGGSGIFLGYAWYTQISSTNCSFNSQSGIDITSSSYSIFSNNTFSANIFYGIVIGDSTSCVIWMSTISENEIKNVDVDSLSSGNEWNNGSLGNFWGDYSILYPDAQVAPDDITWDTPYVIGTDYDFHPLVNPQGIPVEGDSQLQPDSGSNGDENIIPIIPAYNPTILFGFMVIGIALIFVRNFKLKPSFIKKI